MPMQTFTLEPQRGAIQGYAGVEKGDMAVAIAAFGGTSMYPWMFLGGLVVAGLIYALIKQRQRLAIQVEFFNLRVVHT